MIEIHLTKNRAFPISIIFGNNTQKLTFDAARCLICDLSEALSDLLPAKSKLEIEEEIEMGDMADGFNQMKRDGQAKRAMNRTSSAEYLQNHNIRYWAKNGGIHLVVQGSDCFIDFWPGTGKWISRVGPKGFGVKNLVDYINSCDAQA